MEEKGEYSGNHEATWGLVRGGGSWERDDFSTGAEARGWQWWSELSWIRCPVLCLLVQSARPLWHHFSQQPCVLKLRGDLSRGLKEEQNCSRWGGVGLWGDFWERRWYPEIGKQEVPSQRYGRTGRHILAFMFLSMGTVHGESMAAVKTQPLLCAFAPQMQPLFLVLLIYKKGRTKGKSQQPFSHSLISTFPLKSKKQWYLTEEWTGVFVFILSLHLPYFCFQNNL